MSNYAFIDSSGEVLEILFFEEAPVDTAIYLNCQKAIYNKYDLQMIKIEPHHPVSGIGYIYNGVDFKPKQPYPSWKWDEAKHCWRPPIVHPGVWPDLATYEIDYLWDEDNRRWVPK